MSEALLSVRNLGVAYGGAGRAVDGVSFDVARGEAVALVGESGSGKTATALALMGLLPPRTARVSGSVLFEGHGLLSAAPDAIRRLRGARIGMVFQEPMTSLNPVLTIGRQMTEGLFVHRGLTRRAAEARAAAMLERVGLSEPVQRLRQYPHELSGGMRQRTMIAMAMVLEPALLVADEPTTALDVSIQAQVLALMAELTREFGTSLLLITHDMGVVAETADRVVVLRHGKVVEEAPARTLFRAPQARYTADLLAAVPRIDDRSRARRADLVAGQPILRFDAVSKVFRGGSFGGGRRVQALDQVSLDVHAGEVVALVGESGSGKSTLGRVAVRLTRPDSGSVFVAGGDFTQLRGRALREARAGIQMIFQDPFASLDPLRTAGQTIAEPLVVLGRRAGARDRAAELMERVGLSRSMLDRKPHQFSGGQRQRLAIARALATGPAIVIADEPTSALDVSVQAQVLDLLAALQRDGGLALLFISHDLAVVRRIADRVAVMRNGRIVEVGRADDVLDRPAHPYTRALIDAAPMPDPERRGRVRLPIPPAARPGPLHEIAPKHWVAT